MVSGLYKVLLIVKFKKFTPERVSWGKIVQLNRKLKASDTVGWIMGMVAGLLKVVLFCKVSF